VTDPISFVRELWTPSSLTRQPAVFAAQLRALYEGCRTSIPFGVLIGAFMVWAFWGEIATSVLFGWFAALLAVSVARAMAQARTPRAVAMDAPLTLHSYRVLLLGVIAAAAVWSSTSFLMLDPAQSRSRLMLGLLLCGICAGASGTLGARLQVAMLFIGVVMVPYTLRHLAVGDEPTIRLGLLALLFMLGMMMVVRNVSRTFETAEELRANSEQHAADLAAERNRFFALFEALPDPLTVLDQDRRIVHVNRAFETTFGWAAGDSIGRVPDFVLPDPKAWSAIAEVLRLGNFAGTRAPLELEFRALDGRSIECEVSVRRVADPAGGPVLYLLRAHDVTERRRIQRMQDRFVSAVSHELRTPLTALSGAIRLLGHPSSANDPARGAELVKIAERNSDRLLHLVNDILDLNRMTSGRLLLEPMDSDASKMVGEALRSIAPFGEEMGVPLEAHVPTGLRIHVDPQRFEQILLNFMSNAIKFSPQGVPVVVTGETDDGRVRITVHDRGPGIAAEHHASVFESFVQVPSEELRRVGGSGLGLTIAKTLAEQMGGHVFLESEPGKGSRFSVEFPSSEAREAL
jgi:PAS domain S-box-containing protein